MILGPRRLLELVKTQGLVKNLCERELTNPEGAGFDIRLNEIYRIKGGTAFLGIEERQTPEVELVAKHEEGKRQTFVFNPGDFYLITTIEEFSLPPNLTVNMKPRSTTFRCGLYIRTGNIAPGFKGRLTFAVKNEGPLPVTLELGCRIVHAQFEEVKGKGNLYRGQWTQHRVTTGGREKQV